MEDPAEYRRMPRTSGTRTMLLQMAELLLEYPDAELRTAAASALDAPDPFLAHAPDLDTVAEWLQFIGQDVTAAQLRAHYAQRGQLLDFFSHPLPTSPAMESIHLIAGVMHALPFHFFDPQHQPTRCELAVHPQHGWAVATELPEVAPGLTACSLTLATKLCQEFDIAPAALVLFTRYTYSSNYENIYVVRFGHGEKDLFDGVRFLAPHRDLLTPEQVASLVDELRAGQAPASTWRALAPAH